MSPGGTHRDTGTGDDLDALPRRGTAEPQLAPGGVLAHVFGHEDGVRAGLDRDAHRLVDHVASTNDETTASLSQGGVEVAEAVEQERDAVRRRTEPKDLLVEHEQRNNTLRAFECAGESDVVVNAQVAREEDDRPHSQRP